MNYSVIPEPCSFNITDEAIVFDLSDGIIFEGNDETEKCIENLRAFIEEVFFLQPFPMARTKIRLEISGKGESEGYFIRTERDRVVLSGNDEKGLFYAVQTLKQLLFCGEGKLCSMEIEDKPRFSVRGFMLDCGRYFFTVEAVKQFIDMMALHKLNEFHWHLSEDQGFRCQLEGKLLLTEIGSYRSHTNFNNKPHSGYYTRSDLEEIIAYAHDRYIKVIPEIDSPGHVMSMLAAYPSLACAERDYDVSTSWGVKHDVLCVGKESTFDFMKSLFDELTEIFTDGVIHLGGDEVPTVRWKSCPDCQKRIKEQGLKDESELHTYYLDRISAYIRGKGIETRMWNDRVKDKMVSKNIIWQLWNGDMSQADVVAELNAGRRFVISCAENYYLNWPYALTNLEKCYNFEPAFPGLTAEGEKNILGIEGCLWTEFVPDMLVADRLTYPRIAAVCESAWSQKEKKDFAAFNKKLQVYYSLLENLGIKPREIKKTSPTGVRKLGEKLWWERRKLCWGAHHNIISDIKFKKIIKEKRVKYESDTDA